MLKTNPVDPPEIGREPWPDELGHAYRIHANWLIQFLQRRFGHEAADDLAQEAFLRLARSPFDWRNPRAVLARVALNAARDHLRRDAAQRRPRLTFAADLDDASVPPDQEEALFHRQVVSQLPRNLRDVYCLSRFSGMTYEEIAAHLGISVKAVEKRMTKALRICVAKFRA